MCITVKVVSITISQSYRLLDVQILAAVSSFSAAASFAEDPFLVAEVVAVVAL